MNKIHTIVIFGEAEKGEYRTAYLCENLTELDHYFGNPPPESRGLYYGIQALLFKSKLIYFRVPEEGYSHHDYLTGLRMLEEQNMIPHLDAICAPGVADHEILNAIQSLCNVHHCILITNESDFYDFLTLGTNQT